MTWKASRSSAVTWRMNSSSRGLPDSATMAWWKRMLAVPTSGQRPAAAACSPSATAWRIAARAAGVASAARRTAAHSTSGRTR